MVQFYSALLISTFLIFKVDPSSAQLAPDTSGAKKSFVYDFINNSLQYPEDAFQQKIERKVYVKFAVEPNGDVTEVRVTKHLYPSLDAEAIRVIKLTSGMWPIGQSYGAPVKTYKVIPIEFKL